MDLDFQIPIQPEDLLSENASYNIQLLNENTVEKNGNKVLDGISRALILFLTYSDVSSRIRKENATEIVQHTNFDAIFSLLQYLFYDEISQVAVKVCYFATNYLTFTRTRLLM